MSAGFDTMWDFTYRGYDVVDPPRHPDGLIRFVDDNATLSFMWTLFKSFEDEPSPIGVDFIFAGFENGKFLGYSAPLPGNMYYVQSGNASCPHWDDPQQAGRGNPQLERCRQHFSGSTDPTTGKATGPPSSVDWYDPRLRSWYQPIIDAGGAHWSAVYIFAEDSSVGITAGKEIRTALGDFLGVFGADYKLSTIENSLKLLVGGEANLYTVYIVDNLGRLIASNIEGVALDSETSAWGVYATHSGNTLISTASTELLALGSWDDVSGVEDILIDVPGVGLTWVRSTKVTDDYGLHWHVVVVEVVQCGVGSYLNEELVEGFPCIECPEDTTCDGSSNLQTLDVDSGHWRISADSTVVLECDLEGACTGGSDAANYCADGYQGPLCSVCDPDGYYFASDVRQCEACKSHSRQIARLMKSPTMIILVIVLVLLVVWGLVVLCAIVHAAVGSPPLPKSLHWLRPAAELLERMKPGFKKVMGRLKLKIKALLSFSQVSANVAFNCAVTFPANFDKVLNGLTIANMNLVPSFACWVPNYDLIDSMVYSSVVPLCVAGVLIFLFAAVRINHKYKREKIDRNIDVPADLRSHFTAKELHTMHKTFLKFDRNGGGSIDHGELKHVLAEFGEERSDREVQDMLNTAFELQVDITDVNDHVGRSKDGKLVPMARKCECGNVYMETTIFCRRCGNRRPPAVTDVEFITFHEFLNLLHKDRVKGSESAFTALVTQVEGRVSFIHGQTFAYLVLLLTFLVFVGSSTTLLQFFKCEEFELPEGGTAKYLAKDLSVSCEGSRYRRSLPLAIAMLLVYPIGIPLVYMVVLLHKRTTLSDHAAMRREALAGFPTTGHLLFLTEQYKPEYYYFECIECVRRLSLASAVGLADGSSAASPFLGVLLSLFFIAVFSEARPFKAEDDCTLGVVLSYSIALLFLAALIIKLDGLDLSKEENYYMGVLLLIVLAFGPVMIVFQIARSFLCQRPTGQNALETRELLKGMDDTSSQGGETTATPPSPSEKNRSSSATAAASSADSTTTSVPSLVEGETVPGKSLESPVGPSSDSALEGGQEWSRSTPDARRRPSMQSDSVSALRLEIVQGKKERQSSRKEKKRLSAPSGNQAGHPPSKTQPLSAVTPKKRTDRGVSNI